MESISPTRRRRAAATPAKTLSAEPKDRVLISLGCDPAFISDVFGDLHEEYADRAAQEGALAARWWYAREILRSAPHLVWSAILNGSPAARARLAAYTLAGIVTLSLITVAWMTRNGPPARLVAAADYSDGIVVNNVRPVQLSIGVVDAAGHRLERTDVRYRRVSGSALQISDHGSLKCTQRGDVVVRAYLGALQKDFVVHCQPIKKLRAAGWGNFVVGEPARTLTVDAIGLDGEPVTRIAARLSVDDTSVATLESGGELRPLRPGLARVEFDIGDQEWGALVTVFERVATFEGLRPDQRWVVAPIHLTRGEYIRWPLPVGDFFMSFGSDSTELPSPRGFGSIKIVATGANMSVTGPIMCMPEVRRGVVNTHCLARGPDATLTIAHPGRGAPNDIVGLVALDRQEWR